MALLKHDAPILFPDITYSFYPVYCGLYGVDYRTVPLADDFSINPADYCADCHPAKECCGQPEKTAKIGGIIFPNPNAPTGCLLALDAIEQILKANPDSVVVVDEAYVDFGGETAIKLVDRYDNLLVVHTLSKSRSLAGLRIGFAVGHPALIEALERVKNSFNSYPLDRLSIVGAVAAMEDTAHFEKCCRAVISTRDTLTAELRTLALKCCPPPPISSSPAIRNAMPPNWPSPCASAISSSATSSCRVSTNSCVSRWARMMSAKR